MKGTDYAAVVGLYDKRGKVLAAPGETCDRVPVASLGQLLANGDIRPATVHAESKPATRGRGRRKEEE